MITLETISISLINKRIIVKEMNITFSHFVHFAFWLLFERLSNRICHSLSIFKETIQWQIQKSFDNMKLKFSSFDKSCSSLSCTSESYMFPVFFIVAKTENFSRVRAEQSDKEISKQWNLIPWFLLSSTCFLLIDILLEIVSKDSSDLAWNSIEEKFCQTRHKILSRF